MNQYIKPSNILLFALLFAKLEVTCKNDNPLVCKSAQDQMTRAFMENSLRGNSSAQDSPYIEWLLPDKFKIFIFVIPLLILYLQGNAQALAKTDSLYRILLNSPLDTTLIYSFHREIGALAYFNPDTAIYYSRKLDSLSVLAEFPKGRAMALNMEGVSHEISGDLQKAIQLYLQAERLAREHGFLNALSNIYNNLGIVYAYLGAFETSLDYHFKSLELADKLTDSVKMSVNYNNIGLRLSHLDQEKRAVEFYQRSLQLNLKLERFRSVGTNYLNLGRAYVITENYDSAIFYYHQAFNVLKRYYPESMDLSLVYNGLAHVYMNLNVLDSAWYYAEETRKSAERTHDFHSELDAISLQGELLRIEGKFLASRHSFLEALAISKEAGLYNTEMDLYRSLAKLSKSMEDYKSAYDFFEKYNTLKDSIFNVEKINDIANIEFTYQVEKQARLDSLEQVKAEQLRLEMEKLARYRANRRNALEYSGIVLFVMMIFLIIVMNRKFRISKRSLNLLRFIFFLIIFEASLVAFDPLIDRISKGEVLIKVLFNCILAFVVFASHHFLEDRLNNLIRRK